MGYTSLARKETLRTRKETLGSKEMILLKSLLRYPWYCDSRAVKLLSNSIVDTCLSPTILISLGTHGNSNL